MVSINNGCPSTTCYTYDANGRRVRKIASGTTTEYIYDVGGNVVAEKVGTTWTKGYVYLGGQLIAQYSNSTTYFVHKDHLGSTRLLTKVDKSVQETDDYMPYGETTAPATTTHKFTGKERDAESSFDYLGARYYSSLQGRFSSPDKIGNDSEIADPQRWNLYVYARSNPLIIVDDFGEDIKYANENSRQILEPLLKQGSESSETFRNAVAEFDGKDKPDVVLRVGYLEAPPGSVRLGETVADIKDIFVGLVWTSSRFDDAKITVDIEQAKANSYNLIDVIGHEIAGHAAVAKKDPMQYEKNIMLDTLKGTPYEKQANEVKARQVEKQIKKERKETEKRRKHDKQKEDYRKHRSKSFLYGSGETCGIKACENP